MRTIYQPMANDKNGKIMYKTHKHKSVTYHQIHIFTLKQPF